MVAPAFRVTVGTTSTRLESDEDDRLQQLHDAGYTEVADELLQLRGLASQQNSEHPVSLSEALNPNNCTICMSVFETEQRCCRLACKHMFHTSCWLRWNTASTTHDCPICRGPGHVVASWAYVNPTLITQFSGRQGQQVANHWQELQNIQGHSSSCAAREDRTPVTPRVQGSQMNIRMGTPDHIGRRAQVHHDGREFRSRSHSESQEGTPRYRPAGNPTGQHVNPPPPSSGGTDCQEPTTAYFPQWGTTYDDDVSWTSATPIFSPMEQAPLKGKFDEVEDKSQSFLKETQLPDDEFGLLLDIGSYGNLSGSMHARKHAAKAIANGRKPIETRRHRPLNVSGVGNGSQSCEFNVTLPIAIPTINGDHKVLQGTYDSPVVPNSPIPSLWGLDACKRTRTIIDTNDNKIYMIPLGATYDLGSVLPNGTSIVQCRQAPSGHLFVPCVAFHEADRQEALGGISLNRNIALPVQGSDSESSGVYQQSPSPARSS